MFNLENDLVYINNKIETLIRSLSFFSFKKTVLKNILKILFSINQNNIIFDEEKVRLYHQNQIEIYSKNFDYSGFNIQYAFNVNQFTNYIKKNNLSPICCNPQLFLHLFEDPDLTQQLYFENKNRDILNTLHPYKTKNPIIFLGTITDKKAEGFFVNGNHRAFNYIISHAPNIEVFCINNPTLMYDCLINDDYKKLCKAMSKYTLYNFCCVKNK